MMDFHQVFGHDSTGRKLRFWAFARAFAACVSNSVTPQLAQGKLTLFSNELSATLTQKHFLESALQKVWKQPGSSRSKQPLVHWWFIVYRLTQSLTGTGCLEGMFTSAIGVLDQTSRERFFLAGALPDVFLVANFVGSRIFFSGKFRGTPYFFCVCVVGGEKSIGFM